MTRKCQKDGFSLWTPVRAVLRSSAVKRLALILILLAAWMAGSILFSSLPSGAYTSYGIRNAWATGTSSVKCKLGECSIDCSEAGSCPRLRCANGLSPECECVACPTPAPTQPLAVGFTYSIPSDEATFADFVGFVSYLLGVELQTEYEVTADSYGTSATNPGGVDATYLLWLIAEDLGGWVKVGNPLPPEYTPPARYLTWAGSSPVLAYRENKSALLDLLGGDTLQPSPEARQRRAEYEQVAQILADMQNQLSATSPRIDLTGICDLHTVNEVLQAISYISGFEATLSNSLVGEATAASIDCGVVGIPTLLKFYVTWLHSPINIGQAMPTLPLEAIPDWIKNAAPAGLYLYTDRSAWIAVLGGEQITSVSAWVPLFN